MEQLGSHAALVGAPEDAMADEPAIRDAAAILARAAADEEAADQARDRYRTRPMIVLEPDERIAPLLATGEQVVAVRHGAVFDRRQSVPGSRVPIGVAGDLYVTSRRIVLVGRVILSLGLEEIEEVGLSGERLLLILRTGSSVTVEIGQPSLLRVEIGAARASARV